MSQVNQRIQQLIFQGKKEEAIKALMDEYGLDEEKANEFYERYKKANTKVIKPGVAGKVAKGCGCFSIFFVIVFGWSLYQGLTGLDWGEAVDAEVIGFEVEERVDQYDAKIESWYHTIVEYDFEGKSYIDTLYSSSTSPEYAEGEIIKVKIDPEYPEYASEEYGIGTAIGNAVPWLVLGIFAFVGYRFLSNFQIKLPNIPKDVVEQAKGAREGDEGHQSDESVASEDYQEGKGVGKDGVGIQDSKPKAEKYHSRHSDIERNRKDKRKKQGHPAIVILAGLVFVFAGGYLMYSKYQGNQRGALLEDGDIITGTVTSEYRSGSSSSSSRTYHYEFGYEYNNEYYTYETYFNSDSYNVGDKVQMRVNSDNPELASLNREDDQFRGGSYFWGLFTIVLGGLAVWFGYKEWEKKGFKIKIEKK